MQQENNMNYFIKYLCFIFLLLSACSSSYSKFIMTGAPYDALPDNADVRIVTDEDLTKYDQIGIAEIKNSEKEIRINEAKRIARYYGGDVIMPKKDNDEASDIESFHVLVPIEEEITEPVETVLEEELSKEPVVEKPPEPEPVIEKKPDYSGLPIVPYKILKGELPDLIGQKFRAYLYPDKMMKFPGELRRYSKSNKRLIRVVENRRGITMYLLFGRENAGQLLKYIKAKKRLAFVYSPIVLYKQSYPVVELVDIIE